MNLNGKFHDTTEFANLNEVKMNLIVKFANLAGKSYIKGVAIRFALSFVNVLDATHATRFYRMHDTNT